MTSLSADIPVIGGSEFDSDSDASWPPFKQIELVRTFGATPLGEPEETPIFFINNNVDFDDMDDIAGVRPLSSVLLFKVEHDTKERSPSNAFADLPDYEIFAIGNLEFQTRK